MSFVFPPSGEDVVTRAPVHGLAAMRDELGWAWA
jgi:hypothetical protein